MDQTTPDFPTTMTLTFPTDFCPFTASDREIAELVRALWSGASNQRLAETAAALGYDDLPDTVRLTECDLAMLQQQAEYYRRRYGTDIPF